MEEQWHRQDPLSALAEFMRWAMDKARREVASWPDARIVQDRQGVEWIEMRAEDSRG